MVSSFAENLERRVGDVLDRVPGYRGYRSKEDRRDADRRVREHVATAYAQQADRVERVARELADRRRLTEIGPVDDLARAIRHLVDRVRTASYGYGALFGDRDVDAAALDQLRLFDESLLSGVEELQTPIAALEATQAAGGDLAEPARTASTIVQSLHDRFDLRGQVVETGKPAAAESVLLALGPAGAANAPAHSAYDLKLGEALAILGDDFLVDARIAVSGSDEFRLFRLGGASRGSGGDEEWFFVPRRPEQGLARLRPVAAPPPGGEANLDGGAFTVSTDGSGEGEITGTGGDTGLRAVRYALVTGGGEATDGRGIILDWSGERQAFAGRAVHPNDVELFGMPSERLN